MKLFEPLTVKTMQLKNRIVMPPMASNMRVITDQSRAYYAERAKGGTGLIIVEATMLPYFESPEFVEGLSRLTEDVHEAGAQIAIQLYLEGRDAKDAQIAVSRTGEIRAITLEEIEAAPGRFADAAQKAKIAGFDAVELHSAHGHFFNQFFSPIANQRTDEYGGDLEGRMRMGLSCVRATREAVGDNYPVLYRHTPVEEAPGGYTIEDTLQFASRLVDAGVDILDISPSTGEDKKHAGLAAPITRTVDVPVIAVGGMQDPEAAEAILQEGKADLVAIGRGLLADAFWPQKVAQGRQDEIIECIMCNEFCYGNLRKGIPISCTQNPRTSHEYEA